MFNNIVNPKLCAKYSLNFKLLNEYKHQMIISVLTEKEVPNFQSTFIQCKNLYTVVHGVFGTIEPDIALDFRLFTV